MTRTTARSMTFGVRPIEGVAEDERWHWSVFGEGDDSFIRNGQVAGDREKAERAARAAIALMGGRVVEDLDP